MRAPDARQAGRPGFTLIELLIVVIIILLLLGLLLAGTQKAMLKIDEVRTQNDISQMSQAISAFQTQYNVNYIPSRIRLCELYSQYTSLTAPTANPSLYKYESDSIAFLSKVWPRIISPPTSSTPAQWASSGGWIDWNNDGLAPSGPADLNGVWDLEGQQVIVFFLGGLPAAPGQPAGCKGFSTDPRNPANPASFTTPPNIPVVSPFFDFKGDRLVNFPVVNPFTGVQSSFGTFYAYKDGYGENVYAYFSSYKVRNGYNRYVTSSPPVFTTSDCASVANASITNIAGSYIPWPVGHRAPPNAPTPGTTYNYSIQYENPDTYQIIAPGRDGRFGPGLQLTTTPAGPNWTPSTAGDLDASLISGTGDDGYTGGQPGADDLANFHSRFLGLKNP